MKIEGSPVEKESQSFRSGTTLSIRVSEGMARDLKKIAQQRNISVNKLTNELYTQLLAEETSSRRFLTAQLRGGSKTALQMLDELDATGL